MANDKQGKIFTYNYDRVLGATGEKRCIGLSPSTIAMCLTGLEYGHWKTRWHSTENTPIVQDEIDAITDLAYRELIEEGNCMCCPETNTALDQLTALQLQAMYDGTPQSIGEQLPEFFDGEAGSDVDGNAFENALCESVSNFLQTALQNAANALDVGEAVAIALAIIAGWFNTVVGIVATTLVGIGGSELEAALADEQAFKNVVCCVLKGLRGHEMTQENFRDALANSGCSLDGEEEIVIKTVWQAYASSLSGYRAFLNHYNTRLNPAETELDTDKCPCCESGAIRINHNFEDSTESNPVHQRHMSISWDGDVATIVPYICHGEGAYADEYEFGIGFNTVGGCCVKFRILDDHTFRCGPGVQVDDLDGAYVVGGLGQRIGAWHCVGNCANGHAFGEDDTENHWECADSFYLRVWKSYSGAYPSWLDSGIRIEFDFESVC